ncbi:hypothetical protein BYT27DRAFT_7196384 [Phlegmacium glaucopus]|nr:hypothetical protein BYT27DRAFT_7196384 [Phlegmacium glaucopus]
MTGVTVILNVLTAILITLRILHFERYTPKTMGVEHNSPYMTILIICVESSALHGRPQPGLLHSGLSAS